MREAPCIADNAHRWDTDSGWCLNGCGWRDDGKSAYRRTVPRTAAPRAPEPEQQLEL